MSIFLLEEAKQKVLDVIKQENNKPIPIGVIVGKIKNSDPHLNKNTIYKAVDFLLLNRYIKKNRFDKYVLDYIEYEPDYSQYYECTLDNVNKSLNGYASYIDDNNQKISFFIQCNDLNESVVKDKILVVKLKKEKEKEDDLDYARVVKIISREKILYSASISKENKFLIDDEKFYLTPILDSDINVEEDTRILVKLKKIKNNKAYFVLEKIIGSFDQKGTDIDAIVLNSGFKLEIDKDVNNEANAISYELTEFDKKIRKDLRHKQVISIDPKGSKDLDDAVCVEKLNNNNFLLTVCIADVSYYVKENTLLDKDAFSKCTSAYLPDRVLPMLPEKLSNDICSLNENVDRFCLACEIEIDNKGDIVHSSLIPAIINNKKVFSYDEVNNYFDNDILDMPDSFKHQLKIAKQLYSILRNKKIKNGYIDLDIKEPKVICNENGKPIDVIVAPRGDAQKLIEDFMVLCNEAVTKIAHQLELPFIYRVHDKPEITKLAKLKTELVKMQFHGAREVSEESLSQHQITELIEKNKDHPSFFMLNLMLLMSMSKATYETNNIGHFGLALEDYTHFTSPIRRYSDLIVHRIFWTFLFNKDNTSAKQKSELINSLSLICSECNKKETSAISLEREAIEYKMAEYMEDKVNKQFDAFISTVTSFGFFVTLDNCIEGLVSINSLADDYYTFDQQQMVLVGKNTNKVFTMGQKVKVKLIGADKRTRKIDFSLIS